MPLAGFPSRVPFTTPTGKVRATTRDRALSALSFSSAGSWLQ